MFKLTIALIVVAFAFLGTDGSAMAVSFDCSQATDNNDLLICSNPELSRKDDELYQLYQQERALAVANSGNVAMIDDGQDLFIKTRRQWCGSDFNCTADMYDHRIQVLDTALRVVQFKGGERKLLWGLAGVALFCFFIYFTPTLVAFKRRHPNRWLIFIVNLLTSWTVIAWIFALIWALRKAHISRDGSDGGESGLNVFVNDLRN